MSRRARRRSSSWAHKLWSGKRSRCPHSFCSGVAQTCHDDRVVELKEQLVVVDREKQEGKVKEEGRDRAKENAPWMTWR